MEFKGNFLNKLTFSLLIIILGLGYFIFWILMIDLNYWKYTIFFILVEIFFIFILFSSMQKLIISNNAIVLSSIFHRDKIVNYSEIEYIEENNLNPISKNNPMVMHGYGFARIGNEGIGIKSKNSKSLIIMKYVFIKEWDTIKKEIEKRTGKKIR